MTANKLQLNLELAFDVASDLSRYILIIVDFQLKTPLYVVLPWLSVHELRNSALTSPPL